MLTETLHVDDRVVGVAWAPDGRRALIGVGTRLLLWQHIIGADALTVMPAPYAWPAAWAPDNSGRVVSRHEDRTRSRAAVWAPLDPAAPPLIVASARSTPASSASTWATCAWAPSARCVFCVTNSGAAFTWAPADNLFTAQPPVPFEQPHPGPPGSDTALHGIGALTALWSPDGAFVAVVERRGIIVIEPRATRITRLLLYATTALLAEPARPNVPRDWVASEGVAVSWLPDSRRIRLARRAGGAVFHWNAVEPRAPETAADDRGGIAAPVGDALLELPRDVCGLAIQRAADEWPVKLGFRPADASWAPTGAHALVWGPAASQCAAVHVAVALAAPRPQEFLAPEPVQQLAAAGRAPWLAVATRTQLLIYSAADGELWRAYQGGVRAMAWRSSSRLLAVGEDGALRIIDPWLALPRVVAWPARPAPTLVCHCVDVRACTVAAADADGVLYTCDMGSTPQWRRHETVAMKPVVAMVWTRDDGIVLVSGDGRWGLAFCADRTHAGWAFEGSGAPLNCVRAAVSPDNRRVALASRSEVRVFALTNDKALLFGHLIAAASVDPALAWPTGTKLIFSADNCLHKVDFNPDGGPLQHREKSTSTTVRALGPVIAADAGVPLWAAFVGRRIGRIHTTDIMWFFREIAFGEGSPSGAPEDSEGDDRRPPQ